MPPNTDSDRKERDKRFNQILSKQYRSILRYCIVRFNLSEDAAEDCLQETFLLFYRSMDRFTNFDAIDGWLLKTAMNLSKKYLDRKAREKKTVVSFEELSREAAAASEFQLETGAHPSEELTETDKENLNRVFSHLSPEEIVLWSLYFKNRDSIEQAAEILKVPATTAKGRIQRLRRKLLVLTAELFGEKR